VVVGGFDVAAAGYVSFWLASALARGPRVVLTKLTAGDGVSGRALAVAINSVKLETPEREMLWAWR
jgi:hypothetical protein